MIFAQIDMLKSGVYLIFNTRNGKAYVGSSRNIQRRWSQHRAELRGNRHFSHFLQRDWNKHGEEAFEFRVLEIVTNNRMLLASEQVHLDNIRAGKDVYNSAIVILNER